MRLEIGDAKILVPTAVSRGDVIDVRALISHPMHTGLFRDPDGNPIPARFINDVRVSYGGEEIARFEWTSGISRDPYVQFSLKADKEAPLKMTWKDNTGGTYEQAVDIKFGGPP